MFKAKLSNCLKRSVYVAGNRKKGKKNIGLELSQVEIQSERLFIDC